MGREYEYINSDWKFSRISAFPAGRQSEPKTDDSGWERVELPHTWNSEDCTGAPSRSAECSEGYYRGAGCYRRKIRLSHDYHARQVFIEFAGANAVTVLFVNGKKAGVHEGGYGRFRFDITRLIKAGADNQFSIYVSNAPSDYIAPIGDCGDFTKMGGIYRAVRLISVDRTHIDLMDSGSSGVYITSAPGETVPVHTLVKLTNDGPSERTVIVRAEITGGVTYERAEQKFFLSPYSEHDAEFSQEISCPIKWDGVRSPFLYSMKISLISGGEVIDSVTEQFGVREFYLDRDRGFFLNGIHTDLHGVNHHQDSSVSGWAVTARQRERDYSVIRDMGCNAVRMAHYQHADEEYSICDRMGLCVWTEIPIIGKLCPGEPAEPVLSEKFAETAMSQLRELVCQTYNHPSVIFYGMSNEIYQMSDSIFSLYEKMYAYISANGGGRAAVYADAQFWGKFRELPTDAVGYNRYFGWYKEAGSVELFGEWFDKSHEELPRPLCISEYGGGGAVTQHKDNISWLTDIDPNGERHYENYQSRLHEKIWEQIGTRDYLWGKFIWCMFDFPSAGRKEGDTAGINDKGLCTRDRVPKDAYWFYRSVWSGEKTCHLTEKRFCERPSAVPEVRAYANAERTEIYINGVPAGGGENSQTLPTVFVWKNIRLNAGKNDILLRAYYSDGTVLEDRAVWNGV